MNRDNPAARLLAILEKGQNIPRTESCRIAWQKLLCVENNQALLMSRIGKVMELPEQAIQALRADSPEQSESWEHWANQVNTAFMVQNLNGPWESFINYIDVHSIRYLRLSARILEVASNTKLIAAEELSTVREKLNLIHEEILNAEIPEEVKQYLVRYLRKILTGIDEYSLTGALPLLEAVDTIVGHALLDTSYKGFLRDTELGKKLLDTLSAMANLVTVAVGLPQLTQALVLLSSGN